MNNDPQAPATRIRIDFAQASDPGRDPNKQVNEDSCGYAETRFGHLAVLCDGMGGHYGGKEASRTAITTIFEVFEQMPLSMAPSAALKSAIEEAGRRVYLIGGPPENRARPGSTVVALLVHDKGLDVAHVGDSRAYIIRSNQIYPLTRDHSMVQGMIDAGMLTEESAMGHPDSNKITRALGMRPDVDVEVRPESMELFPGDILMQSSDGLTDLALGREILGATRQALASGGVDHACNMLVKMANDRGGHDNITVQMVRVTDVAKAQTTIPERPAAAPAAPASSPSNVGPPASNPPAYGQPQATAPGGTPAGLAYGARPAPTAPGATPGPGAYGATMPDVAPPSNAWTSGQFQPLPAQPTLAATPPTQPGAYPSRPPGSPTTVVVSPEALAAYRVDAPAGLPLPPPSRTYTPTPPAASAAGGFTPAPGGFAPPGAPFAAPVPQSRGGVMFVILGLSAVIAVLLLVVIWALFLK
jgi:protein phosphatase